MSKAPDVPVVEMSKVGALYSRTDLLKAFSEYFAEALPRAGYEEDHHWTNIRIILCTICCLFGLYAQFGAKFPRDRLVIACCVAAYFAFSGILTLMDLVVIKKSVTFVKLKEGSVSVDVDVPMFSSEVEISLRSREKQVLKKASLGEYFDKDGFLDQEATFATFMSLVKDYEGKRT